MNMTVIKQSPVGMRGNPISRYQDEVVRNQQTWERCMPASAARQALEARGLDVDFIVANDLVRVATPEVCDELELGDEPTFRVLRPYDLLFRAVNAMGMHVSWRKVEWDVRDPGKWGRMRGANSYRHKSWSPAKNVMLWNGVTAEDGVKVLLCEGEADWLSLCQSFPADCVIGLWGGAWTDEIAMTILTPSTPIVMLFDLDKGGDTYRKAITQTLPPTRKGIFSWALPEGRATADLLESMGGRVDMNDLLRLGVLNPTTLRAIARRFTPPATWAEDSIPEWMIHTPSRPHNRQAPQRDAEATRKYVMGLLDSVSGDMGRGEALRLIGHLWGLVARGDADSAEVAHTLKTRYVDVGRDRETKVDRSAIVRDAKRKANA